MPSLRVMVKKCKGKKQQEETGKQQHVIVTKINLFKGFTTKGVRNYDRKLSGMFGSDSTLPCTSTGQESVTA